MSQLFCTELLPASDRIDAWQWNAKQICGDCQIRVPNTTFHGSIDIREVGGLRLTRFSSSPLSFSKWPTDSSRPDDGFCIVITQFAGVRRYVQGGSSVLLHSGDSTLIDSASPWSSSCTTDCARLYFRVPRGIMKDHLRRADIPRVPRIAGQARDGAVLCRISHSLYREAGRMSHEEGAAALEAYFEVLRSCLGSDPQAASRAVELRHQILRYIEAHLSESSLGPVDIAGSMGISVRHLHRLFLMTGRTLGEHIRSRRLKGCRADLANPAMRQKTITEIAFFWGFSDSAHFSHAFRKEFGISPRAFRARALRRVSLEEDGICDLPHADLADLYVESN
jgi:AraC family transcriptional regulator, positive regulator of tynA and feaB